MPLPLQRQFSCSGAVIAIAAAAATGSLFHIHWVLCQGFATSPWSSQFPTLQRNTGRSGLQALRGGLRQSFWEEEIVQEQWKTLLERMNDRVMLIETGLESAQDKVDVVSHSPAAPALWILISLLGVTCLLFSVIGLYCMFSLTLTARQIKEVKRPALRAVLHALALETPSPDRTLDAEVTRRTLRFFRKIAPPIALAESVAAAMQREQEERAAASRGYSSVRISRRDGGTPWDVEVSSIGADAEISVAVEAMDVRVRQRMLDAADIGQPNFSSSDLLDELNQAHHKRLPDFAERAGSLLRKAFASPEDQRALMIALSMAAGALPWNRWRFKEETLCSLVHLGADSRAVVALLLHDLDECLQQPWAVVAKVFIKCPELGEEVVNLIDEKKRLEQLSLLFYLRALSEDSATCHSQERLAASQLARLLYLRGSKDYRAALVEIAEAEQILRNLSSVASRFGLPDEGRALARCVLDLHVPLAHGLGFDALASRGSSNERITPSLENRALRLYFPEDYSMIEAWMREEDELLNRTLQRCLREVRKALDADPDVRALATCKVRGRVKSVYSVVKKLLRQRGVSREDLKAQALKDLLALEVVVDPDPSAEVPSNPEWLAEEWRERAACFAVLDTLQRYAKLTKGWSILPGSTKDYITKSKKSGYRALHITLCTNVTTQMPKASSRAMQRTLDKMTCKLEVHVFSGSMKQKELKGLASHHLYKALELTPDEVFGSLGGRAADSIAPSELRRAVCPLENLDLFGKAFSTNYADLEFEKLCSSCGRSQDGRLTLVDVQQAQHQVSKRVEDFRRALEQRNAKWWVHGVQMVGLWQRAASWDWAKYAAELDPQQKVAMLQKALEMTKKAHAGQVRQSGDPYWTHPLSVADILARALLPPSKPIWEPPRLSVEPEALEQDAQRLWPRIAEGPDDIFAMYTAALLHDTVEDTSMTVEEIEDTFGPVVASLVDGVTKASQASCKSRASRSAQDLRKVLTRAAQDVRVLVIKFADRLHNMRTLEHMPSSKQRRIAEETRAVYVPLAERFGVHIWKTELEELCCRYLNGFAYEEVLEKNQRAKVARFRNRRYIEQYIRTMLVEMQVDSVLQISLSEEPPHTQLRRWAEHPETDSPQPIPRVRIVTKDRDTCWACLGRIHSILPPMPGRLRDYISSPKENLYMCLHTTVLLDGTAVEVYILSSEMDWVAEFGVGAYWRHNEELQNTDTGRSLLAALHSSWILQANQSLTHSLQSLEAMDHSSSQHARKVPRDASLTGAQVPLPSHASGRASIGMESTGGERADTLSLREFRADVDDAAAGLGPVDLNFVHENNESDTTEEDCLFAVQPLLQQISKVAFSFADSEGDGDDVEGGGQLLEELHRAYSEALREKVAVFTPTGRALYLPRDATPLDFAVWNLDTKKGLRAEAAFIDGREAPLNAKLREGQTVLVHLHDGEQPPPLEWAGVHLRYLRTARARAALVDTRTRMLSTEVAIAQGRDALCRELTLHSLDLSLQNALGDEVLTALGRGALPVELVSGQFLAARLHMPLGDASYEYTGNATMVSSESKVYRQSFMLVAEDRPGLMVEVVAVVRECGLEFQRFSAEPCGDCLCIMVAAVETDCALRFGSLMHNLRYRSEPLLLQRIPTDLVDEALDEWIREVPAAMNQPVGTWKREAFALVRERSQDRKSVV